MTPEEAYTCFVGSITVSEFVAPFNSLREAIDSLMKEHWWEGTGKIAPDNLPELITEYVQDDFINR